MFTRLIRSTAVGVMITAFIAGATAGSVTFDDEADLFRNGKSQIESAALSAPFQVRAITRENSTSKAELDREVDNLARRAPSGTVVIGVDPGLRHLHIAANNAYVDAAAVDDAQRTAGSHFRNNDWVGGYAAAVSNLSQVALASRQGTTGNRNTASSPAVGGGTRTGSPSGGRTGGGGIPWLMIILAIAAIFFVRRLFRRRQQAYAGYGQQPYQDPNDPRMSDPRYQGGAGYDPRYGPGYEPQQRRGGGMLGGLLGGLGGGMLGYNLGRRSRQDDPNSGGGILGGGSSGSADSGGFVSGSSDSGDFGGGDSGGSGDSGDF